MNTKSTSALPKNNLFGDLRCDEILYRIKISPDKFNYSDFVKELNQDSSEGEWSDVVCPSRNGDYHAHIAWINEKTHIRIQIGFYSKLAESTTSKDAVSAETCVAKVGKFFKNETADAHVHADFEFNDRQSRFPLPLRTTIGSCKTDIDGIGLRLGDPQAGVTQVWVMNRKDKSLSVQLYADRKIRFNTFSIADEINELRTVTDTLTEVKR